MPLARKLRKINDEAGYETIPGEAIPVFMQNDDSALPLIPSTEITTTIHTFELNNAGHALVYTHADGCTITIPANDDVAFPIGTVILAEQGDPDTITWEAAGGVTIQALGSATISTGQYAVVWFRKSAVNTWIVWGDIQGD